jgi:tetratricopeptide (TPR) repeat protein
MISVRPVSGYGPDQAHNWWLRFQTFEHAKLEPDTPINRARNEFLQIAINSGVPGLLVFLWIFITAIFILTKNIKSAHQEHPENTFESSIHLMVTASFIAYFTQAFFGIASIGIYPLIWVLFGATSTAKKEPCLGFAISKQPQQLLAIVTLSATMLISAYVFKPLLADFYSFKGKVYRHSGDIARASKELGLAIHYNPSQAIYRKDLALIYYEQAKKTNNARLAQQGISIIEQALSIDPDDSSVMANTATGYRISALLAKENSLFNTAGLYYGRTIEACPNFISPRRAMLGMLLTEENYDDAIEQALYILQIDPNDTDVKYRLGLAYEKTGKIGRARRVYSEILAKYPDMADVKIALARTGQ